MSLGALINSLIAGSVRFADQAKNGGPALAGAARCPRAVGQASSVKSMVRSGFDVPQTQAEA
jgi:hypothetical protein